MDIFVNRLKDFFNADNIKHLWARAYEWFEITLKTIFDRIPYEPLRALFTNPWFWFIIIFIVVLIIIFRRK